MSNFDFMNQEQYLKHPSCKALYDYALAAESNYNADHEKCAMKVRFALEQFCVFVSELKNASYAEPVVMLGHYWNRHNKFEFIRILGTENVKLVKEANAISCSFLHSNMPSREDKYPQMLKDLYILLLWLYKELGFRTNLTDRDYDSSKIADHSAVRKDMQGEIQYSSEKLLSELKKYFPNCNTAKLCTVEKKGKTYVVKDIKGRVIDSLIPDEAYHYSEEEKQKLKEELEAVGSEFEQAQKQFYEWEKEQEEEIIRLKEQISDITSGNQIITRQQKEQIGQLKKQVRSFEEERTQTVAFYKQKLQKLGANYDALYEKYQELIPIEEQKGQLQQQIQELLEERNDLKNEFEVKQSDLIREIAQTQIRLEFAQKDLSSMRISQKESLTLIGELKRELLQRERELLHVKDISKDAFEKLQAETAQIINNYQNRANDLELILMRVMEENRAYKEVLSVHNNTNQITGYLQVIHTGITKIEEGVSSYRRNFDEQQLRAFLGQVKVHYETQIADLEKSLREKQERLEREEAEKNRFKDKYIRQLELERDLYYSSREEAKQKKKKGFVGKALLLALILAGIFYVPRVWNVKDAVKGFSAEHSGQQEADETTEQAADVEFADTVPDTEQDMLDMPVSDMEQERDVLNVPVTDGEAEQYIPETAVQEVPVISENTRLEAMKQEREAAKKIPRSISEMETMHSGLKDFILNDGYMEIYHAALGNLEYLGEAYINSHHR